VNVLTALAENQIVVKNEPDAERKAIALAWLFHLVDDIHQPLHTAQLFTIEYPEGARVGCALYPPAMLRAGAKTSRVNASKERGAWPAMRATSPVVTSPQFSL
jgi:S1/P1 Nuclease